MSVEAPISAEEALAAVAASVRPLAPELAQPREACGRVLAQDVAAACPLPEFDSAAMDGYALRAADAAGACPSAPARLPKAGTLYAGGGVKALPPGGALRIMTGAPLPPGADAVVMREHASEDGGIVSLFREPRAGDHLRRRGEDVPAGAPLLRAGRRLRPLDVALLCAQGSTRVAVVARPRCGVVVTGDEVVPSGAVPAAGQVRDAVGPAVQAALERWGAVPVDAGLRRDEPRALAAAFSAVLDRCDALIVCGGVSGGDRDFTRAALEAAGFRAVFAGVAIKPGKPLLFGVAGGKPVFGLPGNPVAALVCLEEFVRPAMEALQGLGARHPSYHLVGKLKRSYPKNAGRTLYLFCRCEETENGFVLDPIRPQGAHMLGMAARADALAVGPTDSSRIEEGAALRFRLLK